MQTAAQEPTPAPAMARLLAGLLAAPLQASPSLPETLDRWIDWPRAVALARALDGTPGGSEGAAADAEGLVAACAQVRARLRAAILEEPAGAAMGPVQAQEPAAALAALRQWHQTLQRKLLVASGQLRGSLRELLAQENADAARLAELDAVMEAVLSPREHALLASLPALLEQRAGQAGMGLRELRSGVRELLLAELELRFLPIDGLLAALPPRQART